MIYISLPERITNLQIENEILKNKLLQQAANTDYIAMMTEVDIPTDKSEEEQNESEI